MREHLVSVLAQNGGNISQTAAVLGVSRNTVKARIARYGLRPAPARYPAEGASSGSSLGPAGRLPSRPVITGLWQPRRLGLLMVRLAASAGAEVPPRDTLDAIADKITSFGGRLEGLSPSGVCGIFGLAPTDEPVALAAYCAIVIRNALRHAAPHPPHLPSITIGVHGAEILVDPGRGAPTLDADGARGAWVALERLLTAAEPEVTLATAAGAALLRRRFILAPLDDGRRGYRIEGPWCAGPSRPRPSGELAGRREELAFLEGRLALAKHGIAQIIDVVGEAGIGKSRLLLELASSKLAEGATYLEGRCSAASVSTPYYPVLAIIRDACAITEAHGADAVRSRVAAAAHKAGLEGSDLVDRLVPLLTAEVGPDLEVDPELLKKRTFAAIRQLLTSYSRLAPPLLIAVEDLHWIDPTSEACLASVVEGLGGAPILIVATYRAGYRPPWAGRANVTQLALPPSRRGTAAT